MTITVQRLALDRDAGIQSPSFWVATYRGAHTNIQALVCDQCTQDHIKVTVAVAAEVEKAVPAL